MTKTSKLFIYSLILVMPTLHGSQERIIRTITGCLYQLAGSAYFNRAALFNITNAGNTRLSRATDFSSEILYPVSCLLSGIGLSTLKTDDKNEQSPWFRGAAVVSGASATLQLIIKSVEFDRTQNIPSQIGGLALYGAILGKSILDYKHNTPKKTVPLDKDETEKRDESEKPA